MKLAQPFYRLPLRFEVARLQAEVGQFAEDVWQRHPSGYAGNSAIRLISAEGRENDHTVGAMAATDALMRCPYILQILESFGVVWSRSRLMRLAPGAVVPEHVDINYHWYHRVRIHIPIVTVPGVRFNCGNETVHMAAGEAWVFDNWRRHSVENGSDIHRVHLVADTTGSAAFWEGVEASRSADRTAPLSGSTPLLSWRPDGQAQLLFERHNSATVMPPAEIEQLLNDLADDLETPHDAESEQAVALFRALLKGFCHEWRLGWSLHADEPEGWPKYAYLRDYLLDAVHKVPPLRCASNAMDAVVVLKARVMVYALNPARSVAAVDRDRTLG